MKGNERTGDFHPPSQAWRKKRWNWSMQALAPNTHTHTHANFEIQSRHTSPEFQSKIHFHIFCLSTRDVLFMDPFLPALLFSFQRWSLHSPLFFKRAHPCPHLSFVSALLLLLLFSFERWSQHSPLFFKLAHPCPHLSFVLVALLLLLFVLRERKVLQNLKREKKKSWW